MKGLTGLALLVAGTGLMLHNLPYLVRDQAVIWLQQQGVEQAQLGAIEVNWLRGELAVRGLVMRSIGKEPLLLDKLVLDIDYAALADKQLRLSRVELSGLQGRYSDTDEGRWLGPLALDPLLKADNDTPQAAEEPPASEWQLGLDAVQIRALDWTSVLGSQSYPLEISQLELSPLSTWAPQQDTRIQAAGRVLGADFNLTLTASPLAETPAGRVQISLQGLPLEALPHPGLQTLAGRLNLNLESDFSYSQGGVLKAAPGGEISLRQAVVKMPELSARLGQLYWKGHADLKTSADQLALKHSGQLRLDNLNAEQAGQQLALRQLSFSGESLWQGFAQGRFEHNGELAVQGLTAQAGADQADLASVLWQGRSQLSLASNPPAISQQGKVSLDQLQLERLPQVRVQLASLNTPLRWQLTPELKVELDALTLQGVQLESPEHSYSLAKLTGLQLQQLALQGDQLSVQQVGLQQLAVAQSQQTPLLELQSLQLVGLNADTAQADVASVRIDGSRTRLMRGRDGAMTDVERLQRIIATLAPTAQAAPDTAVANLAATTQAEPYHWRIGEFAMQGDNQVLFNDSSVNPQFDARMDISQLSIGELDNQSAQVTPFALKGALNQFGDVQLSGEISAFAEPFSGRWQGGVQNAELPPLSPYSIPLLGYFLRSGQLSISTQGTIREGQIEGNNKIRLANVTVRPEASDQVSKVTKRLSMPLETAIALLSDSRDNIKLDVPISGSLDNPEFGYQSIIQRIAEKGVKQAAFSFLTQALQPYGTLISLARTAVTSDLQTAFIRLSPVEFAPGEAELDARARDYLTKMSDMLLEKEGLRLNVCGVATPADRAELAPEVADQAAEEGLDEALQAQALEARLRTLASLRAEVVKRQLQLNISADRLFTCYAKVLSKPEGELRGPRVELAL